MHERNFPKNSAFLDKRAGLASYARGSYLSQNLPPSKRCEGSLGFLIFGLFGSSLKCLSATDLRPWFALRDWTQYDRIGVFAARSPFRPNRLGLSSVRLEAVKAGELVVAGADLLDGTPIFDVKPYVREDVHEDARFGFTQKAKATYEVIIDPQITASLPSAYVDKLTAVLAEDPRPAYHSDPERIYGFTFGGYEIKFRVDGVVRVLSVTRI